MSNSSGDVGKSADQGIKASKLVQELRDGVSKNGSYVPKRGEDYIGASGP